MTTMRLRPVSDEPEPFISRDEFPEIAAEHWRTAKSAYAEAFRATANLHYLFHKPGEVRVVGTVTGALHEAETLRDQADRLVIELDAIVKAGRRTK